MATLPRAVRPSAPGAAVLAAQPPGRTAPERGPVRLPGPDPSAAPGPRSAVRSWPLLVLAAPAAAEVWSGWVGIAARTGFGLISPLPGIWPSLHIDTTLTLPVGVEAYAAYALRAWLAPAGAVSQRTRRFARQSAIFSFALGGSGHVAYHLLEQAWITRAPWAVTTIMSCRSWSWRWGPRSRTCCTATRWPRRPDQALPGTSAQIGPRARSARTRPRPLRTGRTT